MTEKEWLGSKIRAWMFKDLGQHPPDRKVRSWPSRVVEGSAIFCRQRARPQWK